MPDRFYYICDSKRKIADGKCDGASCKLVNRGENGYCERTSDPKYAKNKFDRKNFQFVYNEPHGDYDIYSEVNKKGEYL